jgi:hypothetical protein
MICQWLYLEKILDETTTKEGNIKMFEQAASELKVCCT